MKVCIVSLNIVPFFVRSPQSQFGGAETQAGFVARALETAGVEVVLVVADRRESDRMPYPSENAFATSDGLPGLRFFHPRMTGIVGALERAGADVYYQRNAGALTGIASWYCRRNGRVFVYGAGSDTDFSLRDVIISGTTKWRDRMLYMYGLRRADGIVVQSERQAKACRDVLSCEPRVIPNGILPPNGVASLDERQSQVVWVGSLREVKQPDAFLELAKRLPEIPFVMIGGSVDSDPGCAVRVRGEARSIPNLTMTGRVTQEEVTRTLARASLLVNTSRFEGFPNAFLEAWACGVPVVSLVDVDDVLRREQVGVVCSDVGRLTDEVRSLMGDAARRRAMGERARALVSRLYAPDVLGPEYVRYFGELLSSRK